MCRFIRHMFCPSVIDLAVTVAARSGRMTECARPAASIRRAGYAFVRRFALVRQITEVEGMAMLARTRP